jgi:anti-sigma regulatory factor (Ser/Thr protein kinase)
MVVAVRERGEDVRRFILENIEKHPKAIAALTAKQFSVSRQAVNRHLQNLTVEGALTATGNTRNKSYKLCPLQEFRQLYLIDPSLEEHTVWESDVRPFLGNIPLNIKDIWNYCFTEMFNNAIDHSQGSSIFVSITKTAANTQMALLDNGVGIFKKIQSAMKLADERHAILELCKGKLTTDPAKHTGQGIFFTSRLLDSFDILAGGVYLSHVKGEEEDWILERESNSSGSTIFMKLNNHTAQTCQKVFDFYSGGDDYGFIKTVVPVKLARYGNDALVSRSQAKRLLTRIDRFETVLFDFDGVPTIGQAFADEIFRVFANQHPTMHLIATKTSPEVERMITAARAERPQFPPIDLSLL